MWGSREVMLACTEGEAPGRTPFSCCACTCSSQLLSGCSSSLRLSGSLVLPTWHLHACSELPASCPQPVRLWQTPRPPSGCTESCGQTASAQIARCTLPSSRRAAGASMVVLATSAGGHMLYIRQACVNSASNAQIQHWVTARICISGSLTCLLCKSGSSSVKLRAACKRCNVLSGGAHGPLCMATCASHAPSVFALLQNC